MKPSSATPFTVLRFTLTHTEGGVLTQRRETVGGFVDPELAFTAARLRAGQALRQLAIEAGACPPEERPVLEINDTEWGYDLRRNGQIVDRFWVHDSHSKQVG